MQRYAKDDGGFSLIEMVVSIFILSITLLALLSTLITSLRAAQENEARVRATALSNELLERMIAQPWDRLGLYVDEAPDLTLEGQQVVLLPGTRDASASPPDPVPRADESVVRDGRDYTVRRWVTWVDDGGGQDFKRLVVELEWDVRGSARTMRTESLRSPDPDERVSLEVQFSELVNHSTDIDEVALDQLANADPIRIGITVTDPDAEVWVRFTDRGGATHEYPSVGSGLTRSWIIGADAALFEHGPATFAVTAETPGPDGETASNVETIKFFQPLVVGSPVVSHADGRAPICVTSDGAPVSPVAVDVAIEGMSWTDAVAPVILLDWPENDAPLQMEPVDDTPDGGTFRVDVPGTFAPGPLSFTVTATRTASDPNLADEGDNTAAVEVTESTVEPPC